MLLNMSERHNDTDDLDTWQPLKTVTAPVLNLFHVKTCCTAVATAALSGPHEKQDVERSADGDAAGRSEDDRKRHRAYVDQRLNDFAAFERRARGIDVRNFRRN